MRLLLIRHGQTPANVAGIIDAAPPGPGLTALGLAQAGALPTALADEPIDGVYASILRRTQLTAAPLGEARGQAVRVQPGIEEILGGSLEQRSDREAAVAYQETIAAWILGDLDRRMPGGHDGHAFFDRFDAGIRGIADVHDADATVAVISHGAAMRAWIVARAVNLEPEFLLDHDLDNTSLVELEGDPGGAWTMARWHAEPLGGRQLLDVTADDPTGHSLAHVAADAS